MNLSTIRWLTLFSPLNFSHFLKLIEGLEYKLFPEMDTLDRLGLSIRGVLQRVLVLLRFYNKIFFLLLLCHEKGLRQLRILLLEYLFLVRWKAGHIVSDAEPPGGVRLVVLLQLDVDFFDILWLYWLGLFLFHWLLLRQLGLFLLTRGDLLELLWAGVDEVLEYCLHGFFCLDVH